MMTKPHIAVGLIVLLISVSFAFAAKPYDFRSSDAYIKLSEEERQRLEAVHRDFLLLWGALDKYADEHAGKLPTQLEELVPGILRELPSDPFATDQSAQEKDTPGYTISKSGRGYHYKTGAPGNRAWVIVSIGLSTFPYFAESGKIRRYVRKGTWKSSIPSRPYL